MIEQLQNVLYLIVGLGLVYTFLSLLFIAYYRAKLYYAEGLVNLYLASREEQKETRAESA